MEKLKEYCKNRVYEGRINYRYPGIKDTYTRQIYTELGEEKVRWINKKGKVARKELIDLFEDTWKKSSLKSDKLEATIIQWKAKE